MGLQCVSLKTRAAKHKKPNKISEKINYHSKQDHNSHRVYVIILSLHSELVAGKDVLIFDSYLTYKWIN